MHWYEWVFGGFGVAVVAAVWKFLTRASAPQISPTDRPTGATNSPMARGSHISQPINSQTVNVNVGVPRFDDGIRKKPEESQEQEKRPHIARSSIGVTKLAQDENTDVWRQSDDGDEGIIVQFVNEAHDAEGNASVSVKAHLVYRDHVGKECERIVGCWVDEAYQQIEFDVDDTHCLILGVMRDSDFYALENRRKSIARYAEDAPSGHLLSDFLLGTVEVRLTDADLKSVLYSEEFMLVRSPLKAVAHRPPR